jgi:hypothetical protein
VAARWQIVAFPFGGEFTAARAAQTLHKPVKSLSDIHLAAIDEN